MSGKTEALIDQFFGVATHDVAYDTDRKKLFHQSGTKLLREIACDLGLLTGHYHVRSNLGGIAVSGEVTLHAPTLYVQFGQGWKPLDILYRRCDGLKDFCGGTNHWISFADLRQYPECLSKFRHVGGLPERHSSVSDSSCC